ncbi:MAG: hypothetical protein DWQ31_15850 [Planctomycetota bacterium]|nr:MAG: hypothetical protein DWQ31_15850 [Planctomycetota bacterium]REJ97413.1 MAG: hypothetical protein DWQ35_02325 [Planctomycetota bacterium]
MSIRYRTAALTVFSLLCAGTVLAADYRVEPLDEGPPADEVSEEIMAAVAPTGVKVIRGTKRTVCDIWLCKEWAVKPDFTATSEVLYPFTPGQLIGLVRFKRKTPDFRDQELLRGVYTLRYGQQPVDGNHEGTSPTRDFLMVISAEVDRAVEPADADTLEANSSHAAGSNHPAIFCLQTAEAADELPALREHEDREWTILQVVGQAVAGDARRELQLDLVVVGQAAE